MCLVPKMDFFPHIVKTWRNWRKNNKWILSVLLRLNKEQEYLESITKSGKARKQTL